jgi:hypothetical protein
MYRINIKSPGKYHNVALGYRYCFRKKTAKHLIDLFSENEVEFTFEKFVRLTADVFCWTDYDEDDAVFTYYFDKMEEDDE